VQTLYQTNMVECHRAFQISRARPPGILFESFIASIYEITIASSGVILPNADERGENVSVCHYEDGVAAHSDAY
jgi:hypothetical protein